MKDVMIDFETLATTEKALVIQVAAAYFDRHTGNVGKTFKINIDVSSYKDSGLNADIDPNIVLWWLNQSKAAQVSVIEDKESDMFTSRSVYNVFNSLNDFLSEANNIWCHTTFDFKILQWYLNELGIVPTFKYYAARDLRTLLDLAEYDHRKHKFNGTKHTALDDCLFQISYVTE